MRNWLRRVRGAIGMGLTWAVGWTVVGMLGVVVAGALGLNTDVVDVWLPVFAYPGFLGGVTFSTVLGIAGRRKRLEELSVPRFALWGAAAGLTVSLIPAGMVLAGLATATPGSPGAWLFTAILAPPLTIGSAVSAATSLVLAKRTEARLLEAGAAAEGVGLSDGEAHELLG